MNRRVVAGLVVSFGCLAAGSALAQRGERSFEDRPPQLRSFDRDNADRTSSYRSSSTARGYSGGNLLDDPALSGASRSRPTRRLAAVPAGLCGAGRPVRTLPAQAALRVAWCLMEADRPLQAAPAFAQAMELGDARTRQEAAYGRTLAYLRKDLTAEAAIAAADAPQSRQRNAEVGSVILEQRALAAFQDGRYSETVLHLDERTRYAPEQTDLMVLRAYAYLRLGRSSDAERMFRAVERTGVPEGGAGFNAVQEAMGFVRPE